MTTYPMPPPHIVAALRRGQVIPAHPLALTPEGRLDEQHQRALTRYYHAAGAGGIAVGVHTTQFEIRDPKHALLEPVLSLAAETARSCDEQTDRHTALIAGLCGDTRQAAREARLSRELGYHAGLLSLAAMADADDDTLLSHCDTIAKEIPLFGFYLQPAVGGRPLSFSFWRRLVEIPNVVAIKIAPFDRYRTLSVIRAVAEADRAEEVALYTGNDDNILVDLLTEFAIPYKGSTRRLRIVGGLLGHWACWTRRAVALLADCKRACGSQTIPSRLLTTAAQITDCNAALFDAANCYAGAIAGIHEILFRQGLLSSTRCLNPTELLSPGQREEIDRVCASYPHLNDDAFVRAHLDDWLAG